MKFYQSSIFCVTLALLALSDETRSRDYFRDQNVTLHRVTRLARDHFRDKNGIDSGLETSIDTKMSQSDC